MSRSKRRPKPKKPGDGCFLCDPVQQAAAARRLEERVANADTYATLNEDPEHAKHEANCVDLDWTDAAEWGSPWASDT